MNSTVIKKSLVTAAANTAATVGASVHSSELTDHHHFLCISQDKSVILQLHEVQG